MREGREGGKERGEWEDRGGEGKGGRTKQERGDKERQAIKISVIERGNFRGIYNPINTWGRRTCTCRKLHPAYKCANLAQTQTQKGRDCPYKHSVQCTNYTRTWHLYCISQGKSHRVGL